MVYYKNRGLESMTTPIERRQAIERTERFLCRLMDSSENAFRPNDIRREAYRCLRHYPDSWYMEEAAIESPRIWGTVQLDGLKITSMAFAPDEAQGKFEED